MSHRKSRLLFVIFLIGTILTGRAQINTDQVMRIGANTHYFEDYVLSIQYFNQVISVNPHLARPYFYRAVAKLNLDDYIGAEEDASLALERNPFIMDAYEVRGIARQSLRKNKAAIEDYDKVLEMQPDSRGVLFNKAIALHDTRDTIGAAKTFDLLIRKYPKFENAYTGRARLRLEMKDTIGAKNDIEKALEINSGAINAYILRADISIKSGKDFESALADMDMAVKIEPQHAGLYINRAYLRYMNDDLRGAFEDYDRAIEIDPVNTIAIFNRGLLRAEVHDTNRAIEDFTKVLDLNPNDYKTLYNRSILLAEIGDYSNAIRDLDKVIDAFPDFAAAYFLRFDIKRRKGDIRSAQKDYDHSLALAKTSVQLPADRQFGIDDSTPADGTLGGSTQSIHTTDSHESPETITETQEQVKRRFSSLTTVSNNFRQDMDYSSASDIRGRVQDKDMRVELEPYFLITYYTSPTEIKLNSEYIREVDDLNATRLLRFVLQVANRESGLNGPETDDAHRSSIEFYNSYIANHSPRAIDYLGRAMDFITLKNYDKAITDLSRAIELTPDFAVAYLLRAQASYLSVIDRYGSLPDLRTIPIEELRDALDDIDRVIRLSPTMPVAAYNKGVMLAESGAYDEAIKAFSRAIELKPDFGEAYYNRGFVYLSLGDSRKAFPDLSRSGELGIVPSYSLLKRMGAQ